MNTFNEILEIMRSFPKKYPFLERIVRISMTEDDLPCLTMITERQNKEIIDIASELTRKIGFKFDIVTGVGCFVSLNNIVVSTSGLSSPVPFRVLSYNLNEGRRLTHILTSVDELSRYIYSCDDINIIFFYEIADIVSLYKENGEILGLVHKFLKKLDEHFRDSTDKVHSSFDINFIFSIEPEVLQNKK